jgi:uncharacterized paraquat-inducible protein A
VSETKILPCPLGCPVDYCASLYGDDRGSCVERGWNDTEAIESCPLCDAMTWHRDGQCLRCPHRLKENE